MEGTNGGWAPRRSRQRRRRRKRTAAGSCDRLGPLPEERVPAHQRLGPRHRAPPTPPRARPTIDADGFTLVESRRRGRRRAPRHPRHRRPILCPAPSTVVGGGPRPSSHAPLCGPVGATKGAVEGANGVRRRRRRHRSKRPRGINIAVTPNYVDNAATDPLALEPCEDVGPPIWVDPMLDELAAFLVARPSTPATASLQARPALSEPLSPPRMTRLCFAADEASGEVGGDAAAVGSPLAATPAVEALGAIGGDAAADAEAPGVDGVVVAVVASDNDVGAPLLASPVADPPTAPAPVAAAPTAASVAAFIDSMRLPLQEPLIKSPPRTRTSRVVDDDWIPRRSVRLAAKSAFRDPNHEKQARRAVTNTPDDMIATKFHEAFANAHPSSRREAMREFFRLRGGRWLARVEGLHEP
uniref:Uncharacterized protein n=1 Tax=Setaria italica TaxID=4555 RepID=K3ZDB4_SETIT